MSVLFKILVLISTVFASQMSCLSLDEIHSSSQTFKNIPFVNKNDKTLGSALDTVRKRRQEYPFSRFYGPYSFPVQASEYYERFIPFAKKQTEEFVDVPIGSNEIESNYVDEPSTNDLFSTALAIKLSKLFEQNNEKEPNARIGVYNGMKRKRSTSKHNKHNLMLEQNNDFKIIKQHVEDLAKQRTGLSKTKIKRKSTRRVLNDHFNIQENIAVIDRNTKPAVIENSRNSNASLVSPHSSSSSKTSFSSQKTGEKNMKQKELKKSIKKRTPVMIDNSSVHNESKMKSNELKATDKNLMSELTNILADDNKNEKSNINTNQIKKNPKNDSQSPPEHQTKQSLNLIKKKNKRSNSNELYISQDNNNDENDLIYPNENKAEEVKSVSESENEWQTTNEDFDEWLRKEYYKNIAKTLATMRRKRSKSADLFADDYETDGSDAMDSREDSIGENLISIDEGDENNEDDINNNDSKNSEKVDDESDDDYVIATQDDDESPDKDIDESLIWSDIEDKNKNHKSKRSVSSYFGEIDDNIETNDIDSGRFAHTDKKLEVIEDALISEALDLIRETARKGSQSEAESRKIENRVDAAHDIEDMRLSLNDLHKTVVKMNNENTDSQNEQELDNNISNPIITEIDVKKRIDLVNSNRECYALEMLSNDCSAVANLVPNGRVKDSFTEACNWHQICYTCGEVYGLLSSDCDVGFLEASRLSCDGSPSCETFARLILGPLRQSRVFYKSNVPQTCYQHQCIRDFLFDSRDRKR